MVTRVRPLTLKTKERESPRTSAVSSPIRSSASSVSSQSAPRGIASFKRPAEAGADRRFHRRRRHLASLLLLHLGKMHPLQIEAEAGGRHWGPEAADEVVVAAAAAEDVAERRVVDLDDRARVVAEVAEQAEVELHPARRRPARPAGRRSAAAAARRARRRRRRAPGPDRGPPPRPAGRAAAGASRARARRALRPRRRPSPAPRGCAPRAGRGCVRGALPGRRAR